MKSDKINNKHKNIFESDTNIKQLIENYRYYENINKDDTKVLKNIDQINESNNEIIDKNIESKNENVSIDNNLNKKINKTKSKTKNKFNAKMIKEKMFECIVKSKKCIAKLKTNIKSKLDNLVSNNKIIEKIKSLNIDRLSLKALVVVGLFVLIGNSVFSWFYNEYISKGTFFGIGNINCNIKQYDSLGNFLGNIDDVASMIYETNLSVTSKNSKFIEMENVGSLDVAYNITFTLDGTTANAGVLYYRFYDVTSEVNSSVITGQHNTKLKAYSASHPIPDNVEFDSSLPVSNLSIIDNSITKGIINIDEEFAENNKRYYRLDYGMYSTANSSLYSGQALSVHTNVYVTQVGATLDGPLDGEVWQVENELQFRNAVSNAVPGDMIRLMSNMTIDGTINISRRLHLDTNGYKLVITGDLVYDFVDFGDLEINTTGTGQIDIGNQLYVNTPKSRIHFIGQNDAYDMYVGGMITLNGIQNEEEDGVLLDNVRIVNNKIGNIPADLNIMSNTRLTIAPGVVVGNVIAVPNSTNIEILNNGSIVQVQMQNMRLLDSFTKPQIYIYNLNVIRGVEGASSIVLPPNARPYRGPNDGNTLIVKGVASSDITVTGSESFGQGDISYTDIVDSVIPVQGEENAYIVYIRNSDDTIRDLLIKYFTEGNSSSVMQDIAEIRKLIVYTVNANYMENINFAFLNSDELPVLDYLDISNARVKDNSVVDRITSNALNNKLSLRTVILPKTLVEIGSGAFQNVMLGRIPSDSAEKFEFLAIPETVNKIESNALTGAKYIKFEGLNPPQIGTNALDNTETGARLFVPESSLELYQNTTNIGSEYVRRTGNLADSRNYFIYNTVGGMGISSFVSGMSVGSAFTVPTSIAYNNQQYNINEIGFASFRDIITPETGTVVTIPSNVKVIRKFAFYGRNITEINLQNIEKIEDYAFYSTKLSNLNANNLITIGNSAFENTTLQNISLDNLINLGNNAFKDNTTLYEINLGKVQVIGDRALYNCPQLGRVYFNNISTKTLNNVEVINLSVGDNSVFNEWGKYLDGRLRVYVPSGNSQGGNTYLSLYKNLFSANEQYIYTNGSIIGSYTHVAVPYNFGEYTVKEVNLNDKNNNLVNGWEIISYQGADLNSSYNIPTTLTVNGTTKNVISIGDYAYRNSSVVLNNTVNLSNSNILKIGDKAFYGLKINSIEASKVTSIGNNAFTLSRLTKAVFNDLNYIGNEAFSNLSTLYSLNVGYAKVFGQNAIANNINLEQLFFSCSDISNMNINEINFSNIGINANKRFRIYVPNDSASVNFYKTLLPQYAQYVYETGTIVGSYVNAPIPYNIGEYSIKQVDINNANGVSVRGWEIIEYHGQDLKTGYTFPSGFNVDSATLNVISVGDNAFIHTTLETGLNVDINSNHLLNIGDNAFKGTKGISSIIANSLVTLGSNAFENSSLTNASFNNLNSIGEYALANMLTLYSVNLGTVKHMEANSLYNLDRLEQIFFEATDLNLSYNNTAITDVGTLTNNRFRVYVTDAIGSNGKPYTETYKTLFASEYKDYFYPKGIIIGSYSQANIPWDIGVYSVRKVTKINSGSINITGFELIEYHGPDLTDTYAMPSTVTANSETYDLISVGDYAYRFSNIVPNNTFGISSSKLLYIGNYAFNSLNGVSSLIADNLVKIGDYAFTNNKLQTINCNNLSYAGKYAFAENLPLNYVNLGTVNYLGDYLFENDAAIEQIFFASTNGNTESGTMNITFGNNAFLNAATQIGNRLRIYVPSGNLSTYYTYVDAYKNSLSADFKGFVYSSGTIVGSYVHSPLPLNIGEYSIKEVTKIKTDGSTATGWEIIEYHGPDVTGTYAIPTTFTANSKTMDVISIGDYAYYYTNSVNGQTWGVNLGTSVINIGNYAFTERNIDEITGNKITYIGKHAFENCEYLVNVVFNGVKTIEEYAFNSNSRMTSVILGEDLITIGNYAFYNPYYGGPGGAAGPRTNFSMSVMQAPTIYANTFPTYRTFIIWRYYNYTVSVPTNASGFTDPPWPAAVMNRVSYTGSFTYNIINDNEIEIISYTGNDTSLTIPNSFTVDGTVYNVTSIGASTFDNTTNLRTLTLPRYLNNIENGFLAGNTSIRTINVDSSNTFFKANAGVLYDFNNEILIRYPNGRTNTGYTLINTTKVIGVGAFTGGNILTTLSIPASVVAISSNSLDNCTSLTTITFSGTTPPMLLGSKIFPNNANLNIRVPNSALNTYRNKINYYPFRSIITGY